MRDKAKENRIRRNAARKGGRRLLDPAKLKAAATTWNTLLKIQLKHRQRAEAKLQEKALLTTAETGLE